VSVIALHEVVVRYGEVTGVGPVTVDVPSNAWHCLIGPNGAGKSSLLRAAAGLVPFAGEVNVHGTDLAGLRPRARARLAALVPQHPLLPPDMVLTDYVLLGRTAHIPALRNESPADLAAAGQALERMDLGSLASRRLSELSGGERQRATLARALAQEAPVLLLDEPTTALDIGHAQQMLETVDRLRHESDLTVLSTMHDLTLAASFADQLVALDRGQVVARGTPTEVLTEDLLRRSYDASVRILTGEDGRLAVIPLRHSPPGDGQG
jgi:iron complex transport system ATP-binding protein